MPSALCLVCAEEDLQTVLFSKGKVDYVSFLVSPGTIIYDVLRALRRCTVVSVSTENIPFLFHVRTEQLQGKLPMVTATCKASSNRHYVNKCVFDVTLYTLPYLRRTLCILNAY